MKSIQMMYKHLNWSNQRIVEVLQSNENHQAMRLFSHVLCAEKVWFTRIEGKDSSHLPIWTDLNLEECVSLIKENEDNFSTLLAKLSDSDLDNVISYQNSKGTEFKTSIGDVLTHVALHGQYHRGQINAQLRFDGTEPVNVDFITFVR